MAGRIGTARRRLGRDEDGAAAVEFAIVGSLLIVLCLAILQFGWALQVRNQMSKAADEAVRYVMLDPEASDESFKAQVTSELQDYDQTKLQVIAGETAVGARTFRTLVVRYDFPISIPGIPSNLLTLQVSRRTPDLAT